MLSGRLATPTSITYRECSAGRGTLVNGGGDYAKARQDKSYLQTEELSCSSGQLSACVYQA